MKRVLFALASIFAASSSLAAHDPVTGINWFECHPRGANQKFMVWTEKVSGDSQIITIGTLGASGIEGIEKFIGSRIDSDDIVTIVSKDESVAVVIENSFDGEFYAGELSIKKNGVVSNQELACEEFVPSTPR